MTEPGIVGKTVAVLGASSPHGTAAVRLLAREGANLALGGRSREQLEALQSEVEAAGSQAVVVGTHLAKRHHPAHLVEAAVEQFGGLDALLFMAYSSAPPLASHEVEAWERSVDVNIKGFLYSVAAALPALRDGRGGYVISGGAEKPSPPDPLHRAARAAVAVLVEELNAELSEEGIVASVVEEREPERCAEAVLAVLRRAKN